MMFADRGEGLDRSPLSPLFIKLICTPRTRQIKPKQENIMTQLIPLLPTPALKCECGKTPTIDEVHEKLYLDYFNNFHSIPRFADHYGISINLAAAIIEDQRNKR